MNLAYKCPAKTYLCFQIPIGIFVLCVALAVCRRTRLKQQQQIQGLHRHGEEEEGPEGESQQQQLVDRGPCTSCQLIQMGMCYFIAIKIAHVYTKKIRLLFLGEMACYHGVCPSCGRIPR